MFAKKNHYDNIKIMQFKLLQFYKVLSNFATSLISTFVPLLIYQQTGNFYLAIACLVIQNLSNLIFNFIFKNLLYKKPQLFLMLRIVPIVLLQVFLLFLEAIPVWAVLGTAIFTGLNYTFKNIPCEVIYNYSVPVNSGSKFLVVTRFCEQLGYILAGLLGGLFLDYIDYTYVIIISLTLYFVSSFPLFIYYIKNRNAKTFNSDTVSNAFLHFESKLEDKRGKIVSKKIFWTYFIEYVVVAVIDAAYAVFGFAVYMSAGSFLMAGLLGSIFEAVYSISTVVVGKLDEKFDITWICSISIVLIGGCLIAMYFTLGQITSYVLYEVIALLWPFMVIFLNQRMLAKSRVVGNSNDCLGGRLNGVLIGQGLMFAVGFVGSLTPLFLASGIIAIFSGLSVPFTEEYTRKILVDYIQNNEPIKRKKFKIFKRNK